MTTAYTIGITPPTLASAEGASRTVLEKAKRAVGFVPNMYQGMAVIPGLLDTYLDGYARFREDAGFAPPEQEIVFLAISRFNGCDYLPHLADMVGNAAHQRLLVGGQSRSEGGAKLRPVEQFAEHVQLALVRSLVADPHGRLSR